MTRAAVIVVLAALLVGCGTPPPSPGEIAQNYVNSIAEGNYADACSALDAHALERLRASMRSNAGCATLLAKCLPTNASVLQKDQAQLFYADVQITTNGPNATVQTSGTAVARKIRQVTLAKQKGRWQLTSYGEVRCRAGHGRAKNGPR